MNLHRPVGRPARFVCAYVAVLGLIPVAVWGDGPANSKAIPPKPDRTLKKDKQFTPKSDQHLAAYEMLTRGAAYLEVNAKNGTSWGGTGWIVDAKRRLIVTNMHVSSGHELNLEYASINAWFPVVKDGEAVHDIAYYRQNVKLIPGTVISTDATRDLALIQLESLPDGAAEFKLAEKSARVGELLHSLAGFPQGSEGLFIYTQGTSRAVYKRTIATGTQIMVMESQMPMNAGNSGGPIVNDRGEVVAVHEGSNILPTVKLVSMSIDVSEVKSFLRDALPLVEPKTVADWNKRGDHHYDAARYDLAMADFNQALKLDPKNAEATSNRGWVHYQKGDPETAKAEFDAALKLDPTFRFALWGRGTVYHDRGENEKAVTEFTQAVRNTTDAKELGLLYNDRGNAYYAQEKYELALADYDRAIEKNPNDAWNHGNRGDTLGQLGRYDEAFPSLDKAIALDRKNAEFWNIAGNLWYTRGNYDQAVRMYSNAILVHSNEPMYYRNRGSAQREVGRYQNAIEDLLKAIEFNVKNHEFWNQLGLAWYGAEKYDQAAVAFGRAIELDANNPTYLENRGDAYQKLNEHEKAVADFTKAIKLEDTPELHTKRGRSYSALGNSKAAKADFATAGEDAESEEVAATNDTSDRTHDRKYIILYNKTKHPLQVYLRFYTKTKDGDWQWFPNTILDARNGNKWPMFDGKPFILWPVEPESALGPLADDTEWKINASRIRVFATFGNGTKGWFKYRTEDMVLVPEDGYIGKSADDFGTAVIPFEE